MLIHSMSRYKTRSIGENGEIHDLEYEIHRLYDKVENLEKIEFRVFMKSDKEDEWFDFKLAQIGEGVLKVTDMFIGKKNHRMKGIPEAIILEAKTVFNKKIISSSNKQKQIYEWRSLDADKVWCRLIEKGLAKYNSTKDIYYLL